MLKQKRPLAAAFLCGVLVVAMTTDEFAMLVVSVLTLVVAVLDLRTKK